MVSSSGSLRDSVLVSSATPLATSGPTKSTSVTLSARMDIEPAKSILETPTAFASLGLAIPAEEWTEKQEERARAAAEAKVKEDEERAAAEEAEREARLKAEYEAAIPEEVSSKVEEALAKSMAQMKEELETKFAEQEEGLLAKISALEAR